MPTVTIEGSIDRMGWEIVIIPIDVAHFFKVSARRNLHAHIFGLGGQNFSEERGTRVR